MPINIQSLLSDLESGIVDLAKTSVKDFAEQATTDGKQLLAVVKDDLIRWTHELENGEITPRDFETFLLGDKDLAKMAALKQEGLALARIDELKNKIFGLIIDTVTSLI